MRGGSVPILLAAIVATACIASALLCAAVPCTAGDIVTIQLLTGAGGTPCAQDPNVKFTSPSVLTPQPAVVGTGAPADPCAVMDFLHLLGTSRAITTTNNADTMAVFTIQFDLPPAAAIANPSLNLTIWADNWAVPYLNSHWLGAYPCGNVQSSVSTANPMYFRTGTNTLAIAVYNGPNCSDMAPRSGPDDAMNLQFEGTVTYDPPPGGGGLNLGWLDCGGLPATENRNFACNTNAGVHTLVGSFLAPCCITAASANEIVMDVQTTGASQAAWWGMRAGACRTGASLLSSYDFTAGPFTCHDYWQGGASGGISEDPPVANRVRIKALGAFPEGSPLITAVPEGMEVYSFKANITSAKSTGLGACAGCTAGACIVLNSIKINQPVSEPGGSKFFSAPARRSYALWQGGAGGDCYGATPARNVTWGSIKSRYR